MRQIKFRAWDKNNQRMIDLGTHGALKRTLQGEAKLVFGENFHDDFIDFGIDAKDFELLQFTGLQDRTGRDIYEGDILEAEEYWGEQDYARVVWNTNELQWWLDRNGKLYEPLRIPFASRNMAFKVVGNIYEHPNLLVKEQ